MQLSNRLISDAGRAFGRVYKASQAKPKGYWLIFVLQKKGNAAILLGSSIIELYNA